MTVIRDNNQWKGLKDIDIDIVPGGRRVFPREKDGRRRIKATSVTDNLPQLQITTKFGEIIIIFLWAMILPEKNIFQR